MTTNAALRNHYVRESTLTASPTRLLTMLYDRLVADLRMAGAAIERRDLVDTHNKLIHAQQIVWELRASLDQTAWDGATGLLLLYDFVLERLVTANTAKDAGMVADCLLVIEPLAEAWHAAAVTAAEANHAGG